MADTYTTASNFGDVVQKAVQTAVQEQLRVAISWATPGMWLPAVYQNGTSSMLVQNFGDITANGQVLGEGTPPTPDTFAFNADEITPAHIGHTIKISDDAQKFSPKDLIQVAVEKLTRLAVDELELVVKTAADSATGISYSNDTAVAGCSDTVTGADFRLMASRARYAKIPTFPDGNYRAILSPRVAHDLMADTATGGWLDVKKYANPSDLLSGEIGTYAGIRFMASNVVTTAETAGAGGVDVLNSYVFGPNAVGWGDLSTLQATFTGFRPDKTDPLGQLCYAGFKARYGAAILATAGERILILRSAATILNSATDA
jgi:N4-gp56 family major capsid protein